MNSTSMKMKKAVGIASIVLLAACFALTVFTAWHATTILDGDASSEMVLADILHREGGLFCDHWCYSTEIRAFYCTQFFRLFLGIFTDWHLARFAGTVTLLALYLAAWGYLSKQLKAGVVCFGLGGSLLLLPFSVIYGRVMLYHSYYICYAILAFLMAALNLAIWKDRKTVHKLLHGVALLGLAFAGGLSGVRMMLVAVAPILCGALIVTVRGYDEKTPALQQWLTLLNRVLPGLVAGVGFCGGYLLNSKVLASRYYFADYGATWLKRPDLYNLSGILDGLFTDFGYDPNRPLISVQGVLSVLSVLAVASLLGLAVLAIVDRSSCADDISCFMGGMAISAVLIVLMCFVVTYNVTEGYTYTIHMLLSVLWLVLLPPFFLGRAVEDGRIQVNGRTLFSLLCAVSLGCNGLVTARFFISPESWQLSYNGLGSNDVRLTEKMTGAVRYLEENGYRYGCAPYWHSSVVTEMTDGKISMAPLLFYDTAVRIHYWLTDTALFGTDPDEPSFMLLNAEQAEKYEPTAMADGAEKVYADEWFTVFRYPTKKGMLQTAGLP